MSHLSQTVHIDADREIVFDLLADPDRAPEWQGLVTDVRDVRGAPGTVGSTVTWLLRVSGRQLDARWTITGAERPVRLESHGTTTGGWARSTIELRPSGTGTTLVAAVDYELPGDILGGFLGLLTGNAIEREFRRSYWRLKGLAEAAAAEQRMAGEAEAAN